MKHGTIGPIEWMILLLGAIVILLITFWLVSMQPVFAKPGDACDGYETTSCTNTVWVLSVGGDDVAEFQTQEECVEWAAQMDEQAPPFTPIDCREEWVERTEL